MAKRPTTPGGPNPPVIPPSPAAVLLASGESPPEPGSDAAPDPDPAGPPDLNGDGDPGGSDALEPFAVLLAPHGRHRGGSVVYGPRETITALIDASAARMATPTDIAIAGVHVRALQET